MTLQDLIKISHDRLNKLFKLYLEDISSPALELQKAMAYAVLNGGKRIRPLLVYATGYAFDAEWESLDVPACALELIHAYSLIHDDLPAMDNADLRRGKPSCHKAFNETLAILAGDSLQPLAFEIMSSHPAPLTSDQRIKMIQLLSNASGMHGMAAGQALDTGGIYTHEEMYQLKTGALLVASIKLGATAAQVTDAEILAALEKYATHFGLAFQLHDDLLDAKQSEYTGKPQGIDSANNKMTYFARYGIEKTQNKIQELVDQGLEAIDILGTRGELLREICRHLFLYKETASLPSQHRYLHK